MLSGTWMPMYPAEPIVSFHYNKIHTVSPSSHKTILTLSPNEKTPSPKSSCTDTWEMVSLSIPSYINSWSNSATVPPKHSVSKQCLLIWCSSFFSVGSEFGVGRQGYYILTFFPTNGCTYCWHIYQLLCQFTFIPKSNVSFNCFTASTHYCQT